MRKSRRDLPEADWQSLKAQLTRLLDMRTSATGTKEQLHALVQVLVSSHPTELVRDCLAEIQRECDQQFELLEHRLGMLVEVQAEISRQSNPHDPLDRLSSYLRRLPPR
jgi:phosphoenolpyruvate carboxylase